MNNQELYELKIKVMQMINNSECVASIVASLESDKEKTDWLYRTRSAKGKAIVIASLGVSDDEKIKMLKLVFEAKDKAIVIASLQSDDKKIELLDTIKSNTEYAQAKVIASLKTDDAKIEFLSCIENVRVRAKIIASLDSDKKKVELIGTVQDEYERLQGLIIDSIKSREIKEKLIATLTRENIKRELREKIIEQELEGKSEEEIVRYIRDQQGRSRRGKLIASLIKREELQYEMFKECRVRVGSVEHSRSVCYLQSVGLLGKSDDEKIQHMIKIANTNERYNISYVIESLSGEGLRVLIQQYPEIYKACIQRSGKIQLAKMTEQVLSIEPEEKQPLEKTKREKLIAEIEEKKGELESLKEKLAELEAQIQAEKDSEGQTK